MAKREPETNLPAGGAAPAEAIQRLFVALCGRGAHGKSWLARWIGGRAIASGREVVIADGDRTNPTLSAYFDDVATPPSADEVDMRDWVPALVERQIAKR